LARGEAKWMQELVTQGGEGMVCVGNGERVATTLDEWRPREDSKRAMCTIYLVPQKREAENLKALFKTVHEYQRYLEKLTVYGG